MIRVPLNMRIITLQKAIVSSLLLCYSNLVHRPTLVLPGNLLETQISDPTQIHTEDGVLELSSRALHLTLS